MSTLTCPHGCHAGWIRAQQTGDGRQIATCAGCGTRVETRGGVRMDRVRSMDQTR